jgi:hypothetical protein
MGCIATSRKDRLNRIAIHRSRYLLQEDLKSPERMFSPTFYRKRKIDTNLFHRQDIYLQNEITIRSYKLYLGHRRRSFTN